MRACGHVGMHDFENSPIGHAPAQASTVPRCVVGSEGASSGQLVRHTSAVTAPTGTDLGRKPATGSSSGLCYFSFLYIYPHPATSLS